MNTPLAVLYCHPLVPPEWIAAHGVRPQWLRFPQAAGCAAAMRRGVCPYAAAWIEHVGSRLPCAAPSRAGGPGVVAIATTTCDQMRYAAAVAAQAGPPDAVFLMHVPRTWQTETARQGYREELRRLGRFLQRHGALAPDGARLAAVMRQYDAARHGWRIRPAGLSARQYAEALARLRGPLEEHPALARGAPQPAARARESAGGPSAPSRGQPDCSFASEPSGGVPVAVIGGPLLEEDFVLYDLIEQAGAHIALDATEGGQRTLPRPFDPRGIVADPFEELARAYFDEFADAIRRPNQGFYDWLVPRLAQHKVRGILVHRYLWCDLWHAEVARMECRCGVPVLDLDAAGQDAGTWPRLVTRVEAFLESLSSARGSTVLAPAHAGPIP